MGSTRANIVDDNTLRSNDDAPTYTQQQALELHQTAAANYKHILQKIRALPDSERLSLADIYRGVNKAPCAPLEFNLHVLFEHFNDIARANFVAHPDLSYDINSLIFYYGFDKLHGFMFALDQSRNNLILAVMTLASKLVGKYDTKYDLSEHMWGKYLFAWVESMTTLSDQPDFTLRKDFLDVWFTSKYNFTWFGTRARERMATALKTLKVAPLAAYTEDDLLSFLDNCRRGVFSREDFARDGPAMALRWIFTQDLTARTAKLEREEMKPLAGGASGMEVDKDATDAMEVDDNMEPVPDGIDLTEVPWHAPWMQALINIDKTIDFTRGYRPETDRIGWIDPAEAQKTYFNKKDGTLENMMAVLKLSS